MRDGVRFSVVIPCARPDRLPALLAALAVQTVSLRELEVVVAAPSLVALEGLSGDLRVVWVETGALLPPGAMRNRGAAEALGEFCCFLDDDCLPPPAWIERICAPFANHPRVAAVGCRVVRACPGFWNGCADYVLFSATQSASDGHRMLGSGALAVRTAVFRQVLGFATDLRASEDWDFGLRLARLGWQSYFTASVEVAHDHRRGDWRGLIRQSYRSGRDSGLEVQRRHSDVLGRSARWALRCASPWAYPWFGVPYACALACLQGWELRAFGVASVGYFPFLLLGRLAYQLGVWRWLRDGRLRLNSKGPLG